jgi:hypothetical protein
VRGGGGGGGEADPRLPIFPYLILSWDFLYFLRGGVSQQGSWQRLYMPASIAQTAESNCTNRSKLLTECNVTLVLRPPGTKTVKFIANCPPAGTGAARHLMTDVHIQIYNQTAGRSTKLTTLGTVPPLRWVKTPVIRV